MFSNVNDAFTVLVEHGDQRKPISITPKDDLASIEHKIGDRFKFDIEQMKNLQIQWYDNDFKRFIDLDNETWSKYAQNNDVEKQLKLVNKQFLQQYPITEGGRRLTEPFYRRTDNSLTLNDSYVVVDRMPSHHTSGITEHRVGSQIEHMNQSIHTDWILNGLGWLLPLISVFAYVGDGVWLIMVYDPESKEQHNYAGLISTLLILFYYLQYDVKINMTHPKLYFFYQSTLLLSILAGDVLYAHYYKNYIGDTFLMVVFFLYGIIDSLFVFIIGYLKWYRQYRVSMGLSIHNLFHLMSRLEVLLIILIPIFTTYDVVSTNSIAFFILYEFFSHTYNNQDLKYLVYSKLSFWLLIIFATATVICENFEYVYDNHAQAAHEAHDEKNEKYYLRVARNFLYASNAMEICASLSCYALLLLQFFSISDKQQENVQETHGLETV